MTLQRGRRYLGLAKNPADSDLLVGQRGLALQLEGDLGVVVDVLDDAVDGGGVVELQVELAVLAQGADRDRPGQQGQERPRGPEP